MSARRCRFCAAPLELSFADLGMSPLSNSYLKREQLDRMEPFYPLHAWVCSSCLLVQLEVWGYDPECLEWRIVDLHIKDAERKNFAAIARSEWKQYSNHVSDWERHRYLTSS